MSNPCAAALPLVKNIAEKTLSPLLNESWLRCQKLMQPQYWRSPPRAKGTTFISLCRRKSALLAVAQAALEDAWELMEYRTCCLQFLDETGCILWQCGDEGVKQQLSQIGFIPGSYWSEEVSGTNAPALSLRTGLPCKVSGSEHYKLELQHWHDCATPIFDNSGRQQAVILLIAPAAQASASDLPLTLALAREIGNALNADSLLEDNNRRLNELYALLNSVEEGVLACDSQGILQYLNQRAAVRLQLDPQHSQGQALNRLLTLPKQLTQTIEQGESLDYVELTFENQQQFIAATLSLKPFAEGDHCGFILLLHPQESVALRKTSPSPTAGFTFANIPATSSEMRRLKRYGFQAAKGRHPILLLGEEGVGKEQIGQAIHNASPRAQGPYIAVDCQALPPELIERELFGCEASENQPFVPSKFELARGGTLYLEQIELLSLPLQSSLLHIIKTGMLLRSNASQMVTINTRIIAGTQANLPKLIKQGKFRRQLFYTLQSFELQIPSLRERKSDIAVIAQHFLHQLGRHFDCRYKVDDEVLQQFMLYPWPGNDMELKNVLERAAMTCHNKTIALQDLPEHILAGDCVLEEENAEPQRLIPLNELELQAILGVAKATKGQLNEMATRLGISRTTLWRRIKQHQLDIAQFKPDVE
ncbi:MAG: dihydroxyacetone kinase operon transcriptional regulator DhaR [Rouxiella aceris]|uniref:dihydroxyacetone kinase operon transcriptional regulator DhaR n=1 Tax=Rouxiella aceris TaxID=2703884 RepID=UPI0028489B5A|nr:dihydroxyacetone kinase operon transcriptional regulator DhaR [Rouxiella aceris]MDR3430919.1 dihydroxyacetone kinase operon transcriptional regulator DhaR [Rouxiella aceris]